MSKHHLVVFANFVRDSGMTLSEAVHYIGNEMDNLDSSIVNAYEATYEELMQFVNEHITE